MTTVLALAPLFARDVEARIKQEERKMQRQIEARAMGLPVELVGAFDDDGDLLRELRMLAADARDPKILASAQEALRLLEQGKTMPDTREQLLAAARELAAHDKQRKAMLGHTAPRAPANRHERRAQKARDRRKAR